MKKRRVLIIRNAYQKDTGGAEQYALNLAIALKNNGKYQPILVTKHQKIIDKCKNNDIETIKGVWNESQEWTRIYYLRYFYITLWYLWIIAYKRIDIVHPQSRDDFVFATNAGYLAKKKVFWTDHADLKYILDRKKHPNPRMQRWILSAVRHTNKIICVSKNEKKLILEVAPELENKLIVIYNGVFKPGDISPIPKNSFVIGSNSRLVEEKGISELLSAFSKIQYTKPLELWLVGGYSENLGRYKKQAVKLNIQKKVKFIGYVDNPNDYVASMDIFIHPSYNEAFSLAVIEACMLGRPIIASRVGGTPEIIDDKTGILIDPKSSDEILHAINKMLSDNNKSKEYGLKARQKALSTFDFQKIVNEKVVKLYKGSR